MGKILNFIKLHRKKKQKDLRLMFLFWDFENKNICNLKEIHILDISKDKLVVEKKYKIPSKIRNLFYDSNLIKKFENLLNECYQNKGDIPKTIDVSKVDFLMIYSKLLKKIYKKYDKNIKSVLCWVGKDD